MRLADEEKRKIIKLYESDFAKIDPDGRTAMLFRAIPAQLERDASCYRVSSVLSGSRNSLSLGIIAEVENPRTVLAAYKSDDPSIGLSRTKNLENFKLYVCDTGPFVIMLFADKDFTENIIYDKLLSDTFPVNLGYLYENAVAQALKASETICFIIRF